MTANHGAPAPRPAAVPGGMIAAGHVAPFLLATFALSWGFELLIALTIGHAAFLEIGLAPLSMFLPAAVALAFQRYTCPGRSRHANGERDASALIGLSYLILTGLYAVVTILAILWSSHSRLLGGIGNLLTTLWVLLLFALHSRVGKEGYRRAGLPLGDFGRGVSIALGVAAFLLVQAALNLISGLGSFPGRQEAILGVPIPQGLYGVGLVVGASLSITGTPLAGLAPTFGEEVAWRGALLNAWRGLGSRRAALLTGLVWGVWHIPVILGGTHTYPPTAAGVLLGLVFFSLWGVVQSYAVIATGSIWVAAFLHGLVNSLYGFSMTYLAHPRDNISSFGLGVWGLVCLCAVVLALLRSPVWAGGGVRKNRAMP